LRGLDEPHTEAMVTSQVGSDVAMRLSAAVFAVTRGNPFFVEEVLRSLADEGIMQLRADTWVLIAPEPEKLHVPGSVRAVIEQRIDRLGEATRSTLDRAAVLGQEFSFRVLCVMSDTSEDAVAWQLERALRARVLVDRSTAGEERFAFIDDQVQEVLYDSLTTLRRRRHHLDAGRAIEALFAEQLNRHLDELARHFTAANDPVKGPQYAYRAEARLDNLFRFDRALGFYGRYARALLVLTRRHAWMRSTRPRMMSCAWSRKA
jgi:predicted ATPase